MPRRVTSRVSRLTSNHVLYTYQAVLTDGSADRHPTAEAIHASDNATLMQNVQPAMDAPSRDGGDAGLLSTMS